MRQRGVRRASHLPDSPLNSLILDTIRRSGPITFERYMALCLYHPEHGYYLHGPERTGPRGDYFTSADVHPVFARLIARQAAEVWERLERPSRFTFVEMGAGRGWFARDFLLGADRAHADFAAALEYIAVEPGVAARARLTARLAEAGLKRRVRMAANLDEVAGVTGAFFSNELVDAFPVHVVTRERNRLREIYVAEEGGELREQTGPLSGAAVAASVARYAPELEEGRRVEVNLASIDWIRTVAEKLTRGIVLTIDYGDLAEYLYTPDRPRGTLMAYHRHTATENFLARPGEQDLTAHVNFSALIDAGSQAGLAFAGLTTQERFLMALGEANQFADLEDPGQSEAERLKARLQLKRLLNPEGMGSVFKVLIQRRGLASPALSGLKFARRSAERPA